jgi:hypothetical protein
MRKQAEEVVLADLILVPPERDAIESNPAALACPGVTPARSQAFGSPP